MLPTPDDFLPVFLQKYRNVIGNRFRLVNHHEMTRVFYPNQFGVRYVVRKSLGEFQKLKFVVLAP